MSGRQSQDAKTAWHVDNNIMFQVPADTARIVCVDEHPVKPWVVTCYDNGLVKFWDYEKNKLLHTFNLEKDDLLKREKLRLLVSPLNQPKSVEKPKLGVIHSVRFFDTDVQKHKFLLAQRLANREGTELLLDPEFYLCNWIVVNADNRIVFLNYITAQQKELKISDLDGKAQNCLTTIGVGPLIAFGGVDGVVRIWDANTWSVAHRLCTTSGHKSVQHIVSAIGVKGETIIVSAGTEGGLFWWKDFGDAPVAKKSQGEILDLSYNGLTGEVISTSSDKSVSWWNIITADFEGQVKSNKTIYARVSRFAHPRFPFHSILTCTSSDSKIFLLNKDGTVSDLLDVNEFPGGRKSRIYDLRSHPNNPSIVFCCTRTSFYVISIGAIVIPTFALTQPKERKAGSRRHTQKLAYVDTSCRIVVSSLKKKAKPQTHKITSSYVKLSASNTGRYLGVFWPDDCRYNILDLHSYDKNNSAWAIIDEGKAQDLAWFGPKDQDLFCIIGLKTEEKKEKVKKNRLIITTTNKKITVEKQIQDLRVGSIDDNAKVKQMPMPSVSNCQVNGLHGGMVIGFHLDAELHNPVLDFERNAKKNVSSSMRSKNSIKHKKSASSSISFNSPDGPKEASTESCMRWIIGTDIDAAQKVDCPNPLWLIWDPLEQYCLLVFPQHFTIVAIRPNFTPVFHHRKTIISALFYKTSLIYYTGTTIECKFLGNIPLVVASSDAEEALDLMEQYDSESLSEHLLPVGVLSLVDVVDDVLYILDAMSVIHQIPFKATQLQFYFLVSGGQPKRAIELIDAFPQSQHYSLAQFMCTRGFQEEAVQIPTLSALTKLKICRQYKLYGTIPKFLPALNDEAIQNGSRNETVKFIKELCIELEDEELCLNILTEAVKLDEAFEKDIILLHAATGAKKKLKSMYDEFVEQKKFSSAIFCAQFLNDSKLLAQTLLDSSNLADYVAFYSHETPADIGNLSSQLDQSLQRDQPNNRCTESEEPKIE